MLANGAPGLPRHSLRRRWVSDRLKPSDDLAVRNHAQIPHIQSRLQAGAPAPAIHGQLSVVSARNSRAGAGFPASPGRRCARPAAGQDVNYLLEGAANERGSTSEREGKTTKSAVLNVIKFSTAWTSNTATNRAS